MGARTYFQFMRQDSSLHRENQGQAHATIFKGHREAYTDVEAQNSLRYIEESGLIAVIRGLEPDVSVKTAEALYAGGVRVMEITVDAVNAIESIEKTARALEGKALVGAGTVLDPASAVAAIRAGAAFLFAPNLDPTVIEAANTYGKVAIPGAMTPTEMVQAVRAGAAAVKIFPANILGPDFVKQVKAPLPHIPIIPTGGVGSHNAADFIKAGALAVGVGGSLLGKDVETGHFDAVTERAKELVTIIQSAKRGQ